MSLSFKKLNPTAAERKFGNIEWYQQASAGKPFTISYPCSACLGLTLGGKKLPVRFELLFYYHQGYMEGYFSKRSLKSISNYYYGRQKRDQGFINKFYKQWRSKYVNSLLKFIAQMGANNLKNYSLEQLLARHSEFSLLYAKFWRECMFLDAFDLYGHELLQKTISGFNINITQDDLEILVTPPQASTLQQERLALLLIAERLRKSQGGQPGTYSQAIKAQPFLLKALARHSRNYHWLYNSYIAAETLMPKHFYRQIVKLLRRPQLLKQEQELRRDLKLLAVKQIKLRNKYGLTRRQSSLVEFFGMLGTLRDERKTYSQMATAELDKLHQAIAGQAGWGRQLVDHVFWWEAGTVFRNPAKFKKEISVRLQQPLFWEFIGPQGGGQLSGQSAVQQNKLMVESIQSQSKLQGMVAYPGVVRGRVRIIKTKEDFSKMKRGDILVAPNTRPEYVPIMKIAGAIISDEGGMTCHSAIVSRELRIPCIVGVQSATALLKDGELIEVDAKNGVIKKLKK